MTKTYNCLTRMGSVVEDPPYIVKFKGREFGALSICNADVYDGLPYQFGVPIGERADWEEKHADKSVTVEFRKDGEATQTLTFDYGEIIP